MKTYVLYNPLAGCGNGETLSGKWLTHFSGEVFHLDITKIEDLPALVASLSSEDQVLLCGGDGTVNRFINALGGTVPQCDVLYFAAGTGNDFLKDIGKAEVDEPFSIKKYLADLPTVTVNDEEHRFLNGVGFGIDGYCCEIGDKQKAASDKPVNYTSIAVKGLLFHYKPTTATVYVDGVSHTYKKVWIAATMKGRYYGGGMMNAPDQDRLAEDGELTLVLFHGKGRLKTLVTFPSIFKGEHVNHKDMVAVHKGKSITVIFDRPASLQIDGETHLNVISYTAKAAELAKVSI